MKAKELIERRVVVAENAFAEIVVYEVDPPKRGSQHRYKYRLAFVVAEVCVLRFDNEDGKGDHLHRGKREYPYQFESVDRLLVDFSAEIKRWQDENSHS